jgi:hypothetical protein
MSIPVSCVSDVLLCYLVRKCPEKANEWQPLQPIISSLLPFFVARKTPGFESEEMARKILSLAVGTLNSRLLIEREVTSDQVRVTELGILFALLHDFPQELKVERDYCVSCGAETPYTRKTHVDARLYYVEGAGQLCSKCWIKTDPEVPKPSGK